MSKRVVVLEEAVSHATWDEKLRQKDRQTWHGGRRSPGEVHEIPDEAYERFTSDKAVNDPRRGARRGLPLVLDADEWEAWNSTERAAAGQVAVTDDQLKQMSAPDLIATLNNYPHLADRVIALEQERRYTRKAIVEHAEKVREAQAAVEDGRDADVSAAADTERRPSTLAAGESSSGSGSLTASQA